MTSEVDQPLEESHREATTETHRDGKQPTLPLRDRDTAVLAREAPGSVERRPPAPVRVPRTERQATTPVHGALAGGIGVRPAGYVTTTWRNRLFALAALLIAFVILVVLLLLA
jgi:hypothetical protein